MKIHLSSIKPGIEEICKNIKQCHSSHEIFLVWENIVIFFIKICYLY